MQTFAEIQPKLAVTPAGDQFEQEADRVAERATATYCCGARPLQHVNSHAAAPPQIVAQGLSSPGRQLDAQTRAFMEPRLGLDLSQVRIHADATAAASARAINATAFTSGANVVFAEGKYRPETPDGRRLLAHELAHVAQQRGSTAVVQRQVTKTEPLSTWGTAPAIVRLQVEHRQTGPAWGYSANGDMTLIEILANTLEPGEWQLVPVGRPQGPRDADVVERAGRGFSCEYPAANFHPGEPLTVIVRRPAADRFSRLPQYIKKYLLTGRTTGFAGNDLERMADEGERLLREGITEADLELAVAPGSVIAVEGGAPKEDLVDSLRRRGFSDFPTREEFYRRLAWQMANTSDFRRWWEKEDIAAYWKEFPEAAAEDWNAFAGERYKIAKEAETAAWLEAFRRIDAAAGAVNAIAIVTIAVAGGFLGAEVAALPVIEIPALPATIQGVPTAVWGKTLAAAGLGGAYLSAVYTRSKEASEHGETNPLVIAATAINDALGPGKVYEAVTNQSLLTGEELKMSRTERIVGGLTGGVETFMNVFGFKDFGPEPVPKVKAPTKPPTPTPRQPHEVPAAAPWTADELAAMQEQGIPSLTQYRAAREAEALKAAQGQQQALNVVAQQETQVVRMAEGGTTGSRTPPVRTVPTISATGSSTVGGTARGPSVFKREGPSTGQRRPYDLEAGARAESGEAEDLAKSMEALKSRDPGQEGKLIQGEFAPENIQRGRTIRTTEYDPSVGDSALLGKNLRKAGFKPSGPNDQAHHMIPSNEPMADQVRKFVMERGFKDINDVDNGVWLPTSKEAPNIGAAYKHEFTFDNPQFRGEYFHRLEDIFMVEGITEIGIRLRLRMLREALLRGELPPAESFAKLPL